MTKKKVRGLGVMPLEIIQCIMMQEPGIYGTICRLNRTMNEAFACDVGKYKTLSARKVREQIRYKQVIETIDAIRTYEALPNGVAHGLNETHDVNGTLIDRCYFVDGLMHGERWSYDAKLGYESIYHYYRGKKHGPSTTWFICDAAVPFLPPRACQPTVRVLYITDKWRNGRRDGIEKVYTGGKLLRVKRWRNGRAHGITKTYYKGELETRQMYLHGQLMYIRGAGEANDNANDNSSDEE